MTSDLTFELMSTKAKTGGAARFGSSATGRGVENRNWKWAKYLTK